MPKKKGGGSWPQSFENSKLPPPQHVLISGDFFIRLICHLDDDYLGFVLYRFTYSLTARSKHFEILTSCLSYLFSRFHGNVNHLETGFSLVYQYLKLFKTDDMILYVHVYYVLFDSNFLIVKKLKFFNSFFRHSIVIDTECKMLHCRKGHSLSRYCKQIMLKTNNIYRKIFASFHISPLSPSFSGGGLKTGRIPMSQITCLLTQHYLGEFEARQNPLCVYKGNK